VTDAHYYKTLFRVWDMFLCDTNGMDVLFRIALAILKTGEDDLLRCTTMSSLYSVLESAPTKMWDAEQLLKVS
jgi:small G protein signaling modulator 3